MQAPYLQNVCVPERQLHRTTELLFPARNRCDSSLASCKISWRQVKKHRCQSSLAQPARDFGRAKLIRKKKLHRFETGSGRGVETIEERQFLVKPGQIRGKFRHRT